MKKSKRKVVVIGKDGKLGSRIVWRMQNSRLANNMEIVPLGRSDDIGSSVSCAAAIIVAVRPVQLRDLARSVHGKLSSDNNLLISLVSGQPARVISRLFGIGSIVCATTNIGVKVGKASTVCMAPYGLSRSQTHLANVLFRNWGKVRWQTEEQVLLASVIATGCMPAVCVNDIEESIRACQAIGLDRQLATALVIDAYEAAIVQYRADLEGGLESIKKSVTTPGGITQSILDYLSRSESGCHKELAFHQAWEFIKRIAA